ncbi:MAG: histidine phosphatase family protein [Oligoflexia bacterium]|nr:histidine phosphatase family protein [Oligoflexia bacterium]
MKIKKQILAAVVFGLLASTAVLAAPAQIVLIRHGEKPPQGNELDAQGWQRANALPGFFSSNPVVDAYGSPVAIYAMKPAHMNADGTNQESDANPEAGSLRPIETVTPLAQGLGLTINESYSRKQIQSLVSDVMGNSSYEGRMVTICWEHSIIPQMAQAFGLTNGPTHWPDSVFDIAWVLHFNGDQVDGFQLVPEALLPGDAMTAAQAAAEFR